MVVNTYIIEWILYSKLYIRSHTSGTGGYIVWGKRKYCIERWKRKTLCDSKVKRGV